MSFKTKFNVKYKQPKDSSNSLEEISALTGIPKNILRQVYKRGLGAHKTNPTSVRSRSGEKKPGGVAPSRRMSADQWAYSRVYGFVMKNPKQIRGPDRDLYEKIKKK